MNQNPRGIDRQVSRGVFLAISGIVIWWLLLFGTIGTALYIAGAWVGVW